jgi:hypothetical protein
MYFKTKEEAFKAIDKLGREKLDVLFGINTT